MIEYIEEAIYKLEAELVAVESVIFGMTDVERNREQLSNLRVYVSNMHTILKALRAVIGELRQ